MKGKRNVTIPLSLTKTEISFLDGLSRKCRQNGCKTLSRTHIIHSLVRIAGEIGLKNNLADCENEFVECLMKSISKYKTIKLSVKK